MKVSFNGGVSPHYNNYNKNNKSIGFQKNKMVYVCSSLATGFEPTEDCLDLKGFIRVNMAKAINCAAVVFKNGDIPIWQHSTLPHFVDDAIPEERKRAMEACFAVVRKADALCYFGPPKGGMIKEIEIAKEEGIPVITPDQLKDIDSIVENSERYKRLKALGLQTNVNGPNS